APQELIFSPVGLRVDLRNARAAAACQRSRSRGREGRECQRQSESPAVHLAHFPTSFSASELTTPKLRRLVISSLRASPSLAKGNLRRYARPLVEGFPRYGAAREGRT